MTTDFSDTIPGTDVRRGLDKDDLIVIAGAGGFIAGSLTRYFHEQGYTRHPRDRPEAAPRLVPARARRRVHLGWT